MTVVLREQLMAVLPDFGRYLGCDGTDIASHSAGQPARARGRTAGLDADWGHHENARIDARIERIAKGGAQKPRQLRCLLLPGDTGADKITPASSTTMLADGDDAGEPLRSAAVAWSNPVLNGDLVAACCNLMQERF
jgi:hypothetical protein